VQGSISWRNTLGTTFLFSFFPWLPPFLRHTRLRLRRVLFSEKTLWGRLSSVARVQLPIHLFRGRPSWWGATSVSYWMCLQKGLQRGVTGSHICWADRHCWISQRKLHIRLYKRSGLGQCHIALLGKWWVRGDEWMMKGTTSVSYWMCLVSCPCPGGGVWLSKRSKRAPFLLINFQFLRFWLQAFYKFPLSCPRGIYNI
jgi:hypothetical protein